MHNNQSHHPAPTAHPAHWQAGGFSIWRYSVKHLPLKDVMRHFAVTINKDGYEVTNLAGTAQYDHHGVRTTVNGIPEYFPITLAVKDKSRLAAGGLIGAADLTVKPKPAEYVAAMKIGIDVDTNTLTALENQLMRTAELSERIQKTQPQDKPFRNFYDDNGILRVRIGSLDSNTAQPYRTVYTVSVGRVFIGEESIKDGDIHQTMLTKERQDYIKREVQANIDRELQPGGKIHRAML